MTRTFILSALAMLLTITTSAQTTLADFENGGTGRLKTGTDYAENLFKVTPKGMNNLDQTGINTSKRYID